MLVLGCAWSPLLPASPIWSVPSGTREAAIRLSSSLPPGTRVAVVTGSYWPVDAVAEWFPYLTGLQNVSTVQGLEFTGRWSEGLATQRAIAECAEETASCLAIALDEHAPSVEVVFLPEGRLPGHANDDCCAALRESLRASSTVLFSAPGATAYRLEGS